MNDLMKHVETAVRPVKALPGRKLQMREEMLAHLQQIADAQAAGGIDSQTATRTAISRFGAADELARKLQDSVPRREILFHWMPTLRVPGSMSFWTVTFWASILELLLVAFLIGGMSLFLDSVLGREVIAVLVLIALIVPPIFLALFAMTGAWAGIFRHRRAPRRIWVYGVALAIYLTIGGIVLFGAEGMDVARIVYTGLMSIAVPAVFSVAAKLMSTQVIAADNQSLRIRQWQAIEL